MRRFLRTASVILGALGTCGLRTGVSLAAPPVRLSLHGCAHLAEAEVERILLLELDSKRADAASVVVTEIVVECGPITSVITVQDPITRKLLRRSIPNTSPEIEGQARLVALAASELLLASWAELELNPRPQVVPEGPVPSGSDLSGARDAVRARLARKTGRSGAFGGSGEDTQLDVDAEQDDRSSANETEDEQPASSPVPRKQRERQIASGLRVLAVASGRGVMGVAGMLYGGGVRMGRDHYGVVAWTLDALLEGGTLEAKDATTSLTAVTVGGMIGFSYKIDPISMRAGGGLRWGVTSAQENDITGEGPSFVTVGPWGWPVLGASATLHTSDGPVVELGAEAGYAVVPVGGSSSSDGSPAIRGAWAGASFAIGFGPPQR